VAVCLEDYSFYRTVYTYAAVWYMLRYAFYSAYKVFCPGYDFLDSTETKGLLSGFQEGRCFKELIM